MLSRSQPVNIAGRDLKFLRDLQQRHGLSGVFQLLDFCFGPLSVIVVYFFHGRSFS